MTTTRSVGGTFIALIQTYVQDLLTATDGKRMDQGEYVYTETAWELLWTQPRVSSHLLWMMQILVLHLKESHWTSLSCLALFLVKKVIQWSSLLNHFLNKKRRINSGGKPWKSEADTIFHNFLTLKPFHHYHCCFIAHKERKKEKNSSSWRLAFNKQSKDIELTKHLVSSFKFASLILFHC